MGQDGIPVVEWQPQVFTSTPWLGKRTTGDL
jgi:hypothetical protein